MTKLKPRPGINVRPIVATNTPPLAATPQVDAPGAEQKAADEPAVAVPGNSPATGTPTPAAVAPVPAVAPVAAPAPVETAAVTLTGGQGVFVQITPATAHEAEPTQRLTLEIPRSLHKIIKINSLNRGTTMTVDVLELLEQLYRPKPKA